MQYGHADDDAAAASAADDDVTGAGAGVDVTNRANNYQRLTIAFDHQFSILVLFS